MKFIKGLLLWIFWCLFVVVTFAWAQEIAGGVTPEVEINIAGFGLPILLTVIMGFVYRIAPGIPDRWRASITILVGAIFGIVAMYYDVSAGNLAAVTFKAGVDYFLTGFMGGASAVGLYEGVYRPAAKPRS